MDIQRSHLLFLKLISAAGFALFASWIAIVQLLAFYKVSPFHYDSAYYLFRSLQLYDVFSELGRMAAVSHVIQNDKDFLDLIFRILMAPFSLTLTYGHMIVVTFFFSLFNLLCLHYTYQRTRSWVQSLLVVGLLFIFPLIYLPYQGIADYWKESIAIFILGNAVMSWLLSDYLNRPAWSLYCSVFLGLLVMQRTALALYVAFLYLPLFGMALLQCFKQDSARVALYKLSLFVLPVTMVGLLVLYFQWELLFNYYIFKAYDYVSYFAVLKQLAYWVIHDQCFRFPMFIFALLFFLSIYFTTDWKRQLRDVIPIFWMVLAFPLIIILSRALYVGFYPIWCILIIALFAVMVPIQFTSEKNKKIYEAIVFSVIFLCSLVQFHLSKLETNKIIANLNGFRHFYDDVTNVIISLPRPHQFSFLVSEDFAKILDHAALNRGIPIQTIAIQGFMSQHDNYYRLEYKQKTNDVQSLAHSIIQGLEHEGMLIFAYCDMKQIAKSIAFENDASTIAIPVVIEQTAYLQRHPFWHVIKKIDSPYGCVYAYRYSKMPLTDKISHKI